MSNLKDWTIEGKKLMHNCVPVVGEPIKSHACVYIAGQWICCNCKEVAPEEIKNVARLANIPHEKSLMYLIQEALPIALDMLIYHAIVTETELNKLLNRDE